MRTGLGASTPAHCQLSITVAIKIVGINIVGIKIVGIKIVGINTGTLMSGISIGVSGSVEPWSLKIGRRPASLFLYRSEARSMNESLIAIDTADVRVAS